jgi:hypothetical protein
VIAVKLEPKRLGDRVINLHENCMRNVDSHYKLFNQKNLTHCLDSEIPKLKICSKPIATALAKL